MVCFFYWFWGFVLLLYFYLKFKKRYWIAINALIEIASTKHDMNKLVYIAIKALNDIDNTK